jgi:F-type H+-transporting ATPase subunit alpha
MINIRADEISNIIQEQLKSYNKDIRTQNVGTVVQIGDGIVKIHGLDEVVNGELIDFGNKTFGIALNLEEHSVGTVLLNNTSQI